MINGNTTKPTRDSTRSVSTSATAATTSMTTTPIAIGSGAIGNQIDSMSAFALDSSWPVGCRWCHDNGSLRYCLVTRRRYFASSR